MTKKNGITKHDTPTDMTEQDTLTDIIESEMTCMRMFILMKPLRSPPVLLLLALLGPQEEKAIVGQQNSETRRGS